MNKPFSLHVPVRFTDEDNQGHANHTAILAYIGEGRIAMIDGMIREAAAYDTDYVLVKIEAEFFKEIKYPEWVEVRGRVKLVGDKSITTAYTVHVGDAVVAKATCVNVFFNKQTKETMMIPSSLRKVFGGQ